MGLYLPELSSTCLSFGALVAEMDRVAARYTASEFSAFVGDLPGHSPVLRNMKAGDLNSSQVLMSRGALTS